MQVDVKNRKIITVTMTAADVAQAAGLPDPATWSFYEPAGSYSIVVEREE